MPTGGFRGRHEDDRLLTGRGRFVINQASPDCAQAVVLRAPFAHARIARLDTAAAKAMPGVLGIFTGSDLADAGLGPLPCITPIENSDGSPMAEPRRPVMAFDAVRHLGEAVALVVAETMQQAMDACEAIEVDYQELPAIIGPEAAISEGAPQLWPEAPGNLAFDWEAGDEGAVEAAFATAAHVSQLTVTHQRLAMSPMEPRAAIGEYDPDEDRLTLRTQTQGVHRIRNILAQQVFKIEKQKLRVITEDVGGSFGVKIYPYPEHVLVLFAARALRRPVLWVASRQEAFLADAQGRARVDTIELAFGPHGEMLALRLDALADLGAYVNTVAPSVVTKGVVIVLGHCFRIPAVRYRVRGAFTNAAPVDAYRGAGKPETISALERLIDQAARELGIDRIELRRRNLITPQDLPYATPLGERYDSGDFPGALEAALKAADWAGFPARRAAARDKGLRAGIALGMNLHTTGGTPLEVCQLHPLSDGRLLLLTGSQSGGQGHETALAKIVGQILEIAAERVVVEQGDSDRLASGGGTGGSCFTSIIATTAERTARALVARAKELASQRLEAAIGDIEYRQGVCRIVGTDRAVGLADLAPSPDDPAPDSKRDCVASLAFEGELKTYPNGAYVVEALVDPETGLVRLQRLTCVNDLGELIEPALALGQLHGGAVQGIGQALLEDVIYDPASGQLLTGSFLDYCLPRADDLPSLENQMRPTRCSTNALAAKGAGEVATNGLPGPVVNAVLDALWDEGVKTIDTPLTAFRVWQAIRAAHSKGS